MTYAEIKYRLKLFKRQNGFLDRCYFGLLKVRSVGALDIFLLHLHARGLESPTTSRIGAELKVWGMSLWRHDADKYAIALFHQPQSPELFLRSTYSSSECIVATRMPADRPPWTQHAPRTSQTPAFQPPPGRSQRILACVLCQQRKVKCDRKFPCANCTRNEAQCVPATQARRQRRLFPERELLDRIHKYEGLLRRNNVEYEPLQKGSNSVEMRGEKRPTGYFVESDEEQSQGDAADGSSPSASVKSESAYDVKYVSDSSSTRMHSFHHWSLIYPFW